METRTATYKFDLLRGRQFMAGDTLTSYAQRRLAELGVVATITYAEAWVESAEVTARNSSGSCAQKSVTVTGEFVQVTVEEELVVPT